MAANWSICTSSDAYHVYFTVIYFSLVLVTLALWPLMVTLILEVVEKTLDELALNEYTVVKFAVPKHFINLRTCSRRNTCLIRLPFTHHRLNSCNYHFGNIGPKHSQWSKQGQQTCCKQEVFFQSEYYFKALYMMLITSALLMVFFGENLFCSVAPMIPLT